MEHSRMVVRPRSELADASLWLSVCIRGWCLAKGQLSIKVRLKAQRQVCLLPKMLTKAEARCLDNLSYPVSENLSHTQMASNKWTVTLWLVHFAERIGGTLATCTVVNLIANISYTLITVALLFFPLVVQLHVAMAFRCSVCHFGQAQWGKRHWRWGNGVVALLQLCESLRRLTKISDVKNSPNCPTAVQERIISFHSPLYIVRQTTPDKSKIRPNSKMSGAAQ